MEEPAAPSPDKPILNRNVSGGLNGPLPYPGTATASQADSHVSYAEEFLADMNRIADVQRSYGDSPGAFDGPYIEGYGPTGSGDCLPDQTLGVDRQGYRGGTDEPLPVRPPAPDEDADYDERPAY